MTRVTYKELALSLYAAGRSADEIARTLEIQQPIVDVWLTDAQPRTMEATIAGVIRSNRGRSLDSDTDAEELTAALTAAVQPLYDRLVDACRIALAFERGDNERAWAVLSLRRARMERLTGKPTLMNDALEALLVEVIARAEAVK